MYIYKGKKCGGKFAITVGEFNGSLEKALELVRKRKMDINKISLSAITDEYISYINKTNIDIKDIANFIVVAGSLLLIKSKTLIPDLRLTENEQEEIHVLENRLKLYAIYRQARKTLTEHISASSYLYAPKWRFIIMRRRVKNFMPPDDLNVTLLLNVAKNVIKQLPVSEDKPRAQIINTATIEESMRRLLRGINLNKKCSFKEISGKDHMKILSHFLALLELLKDEKIFAYQTADDGDIIFASKQN